MGQIKDMWKACYPLGGRPPKFKTPEELEARFEQFIEYVDSHPWQSASSSRRFQKDTNMVQGKEQAQFDTNVQMPVTKQFWEAFSGITNWSQYGESQKPKEGDSNAMRKRKARFLSIITRVNRFIEAHQIAGALVGDYTPNLVSRINGLADKTDVTSNGETIQAPRISLEIIDRREQVRPKEEDAR